jgi:hypothetical protein
VKDQYFADRNDYFKYDLLIFLAEQLAAKKLPIVWMLTENDKSNDGGKTDYPKGAGNRDLYHFLKMALEDGTRYVGRIGDYFKGAGHAFVYCSYGDAETFCHRNRAAYFEEIPKANLGDAVVFLDPDNGFEVKSTGERNGEKYIKLDEVELIYNRMGENSVMVVYQHLPRIHRKSFLYGIANKLVAKLKCPIPLSISDN